MVLRSQHSVYESATSYTFTYECNTCTISQLSIFGISTAYRFYEKDSNPYSNLYLNYISSISYGYPVGLYLSLVEMHTMKIQYIFSIKLISQLSITFSWQIP